MRVATRSLGEALRERVGREVITAGDEHAPAATLDGCPVAWVVSPTRVEQVAAVLAFAQQEALVVAPQGSGSTLELGHPPRRIDVRLDMRGLDRVVEYNPDELTASLQAGVLAGALAERLAPRRQWLPLDPPGWRGRTIGGIVATNASGPLRARYGTLRDLLLGVRFVQADGVVTWGGARVVKSVTGYDVPKLMVGGLGTLGVLVEFTLRLHPMPETERTWLVSFACAEGAQAFAARLLDSTLQPSRIEFLNEPTLRACRLPLASAAVAVAIGSVEAAVRDQGARLDALAGTADGAISAAPDDIWARYDRGGATREGSVLLLVGTLPSRYGETVREVEDCLAMLGSGASAALAGCMASGGLRVTLTGVTVGEAIRVVERVRAFVAPFEGSAVVHGGPRELRRQLDPWGAVDPGALALMRRLKAEFDSARVLNAGRFVGGL
jgi:glycolate oxidase FAD binding subunit